MEKCMKCKTSNSNIKAYLFYYGKTTGRKESQSAFGSTRVTTELSLESAPKSVTFCDNCVGNQLKKTNFLASSKGPLLIVGLVALSLSPIYGFLSFGELVGPGGLFVLLAIGGLAVLLPRFFPSTKEVNQSMGEKMAINLHKSNLKRQGYNYFCTTSEYSLLGIKPTINQIWQMEKSGDQEGLVNAIGIYGKLSDISFEYKNAIYATESLSRIGTTRIVSKLEVLKSNLLIHSSFYSKNSSLGYLNALNNSNEVIHAIDLAIQKINSRTN